MKVIWESLSQHKKKILFGLGMITIGMVLCYYFLLGQNQKKSGVLTATGTIEATRVNISAKISARVENLAVKEGDQVTQGQVLVKLDSAALNAQLTKDEAAVAKAEAYLKDLQAGARQPEIREAQAAVQQAQADLAKAEADWQRINQLYAQGASTAQELDRAKTLLETARAQLTAKQQRLELIRSGSRPEAIAAASHDVEQARAQLEMTKTNLNETILTAPMSGTVLFKGAEPGELVTAGQPILTLIDLAHLWMRIYVPETEIGQVKLGQAVRITVDSFPNREFSGRVVEISPQAEFTPKFIQTKKERVNLVFGVKVELDNSEHLLKPGMPADAEIILESAR
ncbi:MAG: HlyD family efflux transporter periplasmic adaptor subunit [Firmicutes bacterium]|nr:HlyD family efflux transporter periplasmic adaptor subunit [Bacillota bacterium]